jgi:hypothetical protein
VSPSAWALGLRHTLEEAPGGIGFDPLSRPDQKLSDEVPRKESEKRGGQENSTHPSSRKKPSGWFTQRTKDGRSRRWLVT